MTEEVRERIERLEPPTIVLLCEHRECNGGPAALRHAGYRVETDDVALISRGPIRVWVVPLVAMGLRRE